MSRDALRAISAQLDVALVDWLMGLLGIGDVGSQDDGISQVYVLDVFLRFRGVEKEHDSYALAHGSGAIDFDGVDEGD